MKKIIKHIPPYVRQTIDNILAAHGICLAELISPVATSSQTSVWITIKDATALSGLKRPTLYRLAKAKKITIRKLGRARSSKVLVNRNSLLEYIDSCTYGGEK